MHNHKHSLCLLYMPWWRRLIWVYMSFNTVCYSLLYLSTRWVIVWTSMYLTRWTMLVICLWNSSHYTFTNSYSNWNSYTNLNWYRYTDWYTNTQSNIDSLDNKVIGWNTIWNRNSYTNTHTNFYWNSYTNWNILTNFYTNTYTLINKCPCDSLSILNQ